MPTSRSAFTLFEVAVSLAILAVGITVMLTLIPLGLRTQELARARMLASAQVMTVVDSFVNLPSMDRPRIVDNCEVMNELSSTSLPWHSILGRKSSAMDLEIKNSSGYGGLAPVPVNIARRFDSPGNEIQQILDQGGYVYYAQPGLPGGFAAESIETSEFDPPTESGKLVVGIVGYAQSNSVNAFAPRNWPYYAEAAAPPDIRCMRTLPFTVPPASTNDRARAARALAYFVRFMRYNNPPDAGVPTAPENPATNKGPNTGYDIYALSIETATAFDAPNTVAKRQESARQFFAAAWTYADVVRSLTSGMPGNAAFGQALSGVVTPYNTTDGTTPAFRQMIESMVGDGDPAANPHVSAYVAALRSVALAAMCVARHQNVVTGSATIASYTIDKTTTTSNGGMPNWPSPVAPSQRAGLVALLPNTTPATSFNITNVRNWVEASTHLIMRHAASYPYDWGQPRPQGRPIMMDVPLLQWDLFPAGTYTATSDGFLDMVMDPITETMPSFTPGTTAVGANRPWFSTSIAGPAFNHIATNKSMPARAWRWITPQPVLDIGSNQLACYVEESIAKPIWGNSAHFNLTAPFHPTERCRQLVVWSIDWQSYQDFETAPSAPVDASKYPLRAYDNEFDPASQYPQSPLAGLGTMQDFLGGWGVPDYFNNAGSGWAYQMNTGQYGLMKNQANLRDLYISRLRNPEKIRALKSSPAALPTGSSLRTTGGLLTFGAYSTAETVSFPAGFESWNGGYGVDRNGNLTLDRGPTPPSVRLRASEVARFNYYDPRVQLTVR